MHGLPEFTNFSSIITEAGTNVTKLSSFFAALNVTQFNNWKNSKSTYEAGRAQTLNTTEHDNTTPHSNNHGNSNPVVTTPSSHTDNHTNNSGGHSDSTDYSYSLHTNGYCQTQYYSRYDRGSGHHNAGHHNLSSHFQESQGGTRSEQGHANFNYGYSQATYSQSGYSQTIPSYSQARHSDSGYSQSLAHIDTGFDHQNYIPSGTYIFSGLDNTDLPVNKILSDTVSIGFFAYDKNNAGVGTQDTLSKTVKYFLQIKPKTGGVWTTLVNGATSDSYDFNTTAYADGTYILKAWAINDSKSAKGVTKDYVGPVQQIDVVLSQNKAPVISVDNSGEFLNFTFSHTGALSPSSVYKDYSVMFSGAPSNKQQGLYVRVTMKDQNTNNWQKAKMYLKKSDGSLVASSTVDVVWENGSTIIQSANVNKTGVGFIPKASFLALSSATGTKLYLEVTDYTNAACTVLAGSTVVQSQISASNSTQMTINVDAVAPVVDANDKNYNWRSSDISVSLSYTDSGVGIQTKQYKVTTSTAVPSSWDNYASAINITTTTSATYIHYKAVDKAGNSVTGYFGPYKLDKTNPNPPTISVGTPVTNAASATFTVSGGSDTGSGIARLEYKLSGATIKDWTTYTGAVSIANEGVTTIQARTVDNVGRGSTIPSATITIDRTKPSTPSISTNTNWTNSSSVSATITSGTDSGTGVARTEYMLSGATSKSWTTYSGAISITAEGQTTIKARTIDNVGNISTESSVVVKIDRTKPLPPSISTNTNWTNVANVAVTLTNGSDAASGVNRLEYSLSGATTKGWTTYGGAFNISAVGQTTISVRTIDNAGNISNTASAVVKIDRTAPTVPSITTNTNWIDAPSVPVSISHGTDEASGINRTEYSLSGATTRSWTSYTGNFNITNEGQTTILARTYDNAGNVSSNVSAIVKIDRTNPSVPTINGNTAWTKLANVPITITSGSDGGSGVSRLEYWTTGAQVITRREYTGSFNITQEGITTINAVTIDNVGNESSTSTIQIRIDRTLPVISMDPEEGTYLDKVTAQISVSDSASGIATRKYAWTHSSTKPSSGWTNMGGDSVITTVDQVGTWYLHVNVVDVAGNERDFYREYVVIMVAIKGMHIYDVVYPNKWEPSTAFPDLTWEEQGETRVLIKENPTYPYTYAEALSGAMLSFGMVSEGNPENVEYEILMGGTVIISGNMVGSGNTWSKTVTFQNNIPNGTMLSIKITAYRLGFNDEKIYDNCIKIVDNINKLVIFRETM